MIYFLYPIKDLLVVFVKILEIGSTPLHMESGKHGQYFNGRKRNTKKIFNIDVINPFEKSVIKINHKNKMELKYISFWYLHSALTQIHPLHFGHSLGK